MFYEMCDFNKFVKFKGKHRCGVYFLMKLREEACNFMKEETPAKMFFCQFHEIFKKTVFVEHLRATASVFGEFNQNNGITDHHFSLTLLLRRSLSYRNQTIDLLVATSIMKELMLRDKFIKVNIQFSYSFD